MTLLLKGAPLIDGTGADPSSSSVLIDGERIAAIGADVSDSSAEQLDLNGLWLLPGLIDLHSHLGLVEVEPSGRMSAALWAARIFENAELALAAGYTTTREVSGVDGGLVQTIDAGLVNGPRVYPSGPILCQTGGHGDLSSPWELNCGGHRFSDQFIGLGALAVAVDGEDEVRKAARQAFHRGATQLKLCITGGVVSLADKLTDTQFSVREMRAAVEEAKARGTYVTAHTHNNTAIHMGLEAGIECFEHCTHLDEETARAMASAGAAMVPTLSVVHVMAARYEEWGVPPEAIPRLGSAYENMCKSIHLAREHGVLVGSGTDLLGPRQRDKGLELALRAKNEDAMTAITAATRDSAKVMRLNDELGTVETGKLADIIAVDFDPIANPEHFADPDRVRLVIKGGKVCKDTR